MGDLLELSEDILTDMKEIQREGSKKLIHTGVQLYPTSDPLFYNCGVYLIPIDTLIGQVPSIEKFPVRIPKMPDGKILDIHSALHHKTAHIEGNLDREVAGDYLAVRENYLNFMLQFAKRDIMFVFENRAAENPEYLFSHETFFAESVFSNDPEPIAFFSKPVFYINKIGLEMQLELSQKAREKLGINSR